MTCGPCIHSHHFQAEELDSGQQVRVAESVWDLVFSILQLSGSVGIWVFPKIGARPKMDDL